MLGEYLDLLNQPHDGQLGNLLIEALESDEFQSLSVVVAFAKNSGVLRLKDAISSFRVRGGNVTTYVGVDLGGTSYEALTNLLLLVDDLWIVHSENGQTFHPKIYDFVGEKSAMLVVGSNNLTGGGLWTNFESSAIQRSNSKPDAYGNSQTRFADFISNLQLLGPALMKIETQDQIDQLLEGHYIEKEVALRIAASSQSAATKRSERLFGKAPRAKLPRLETSAGEQKALTNEDRPQGNFNIDEGTIWFETGRMTGGSRNILDLSMKSLVERGDPHSTSFAHPDSGFMRGGVEFFGLDPSDTSLRKDVTLNFDGVDYFGNAILYPGGANANGTWRLQVRGVDAAGHRITDAFRLKGEPFYLVKKIVTFNKVREDYFYMSVFPESDLESFCTASAILARNGSSRNSRRMGLL